jgi:hypothetical protein
MHFHRPNLLQKSKSKVSATKRNMDRSVTSLQFRRAGQTSSAAICLVHAEPSTEFARVRPTGKTQTRRKRFWGIGRRPGGDTAPFNGHDKTFFYGTYEGFRYPRAEVIQNEVPTAAERNGDFSADDVTLKDLNGNVIPGNKLDPSKISPIAAKILNTFYPLPNAGDLTVPHTANYITSKNNDYLSDQYDIRVDHYLTSKQSIFGRWTWKDISAFNPQQLLIPSETTPDNYKLLTLAHNYAIEPSLLNEARFGFTLNDASQNFPFDGRAFTNSLGLVGIGPNFPFNGLLTSTLTTTPE